MLLENFSNLFSTIAQVSFGIAGLLFVALTIDEQKKKRWFEKENVTFVAISFLMVVLPGFISLFGLAPDTTPKYLSALATLFYGTILLIWWTKVKVVTKESKAERSRWRWLQKISDVKGDNIGILAAWIYTLLVPPSSALPIISLALIAGVIFSTMSVFSLFRNS